MTLDEALQIGIAAIKAQAGQIEIQAELTTRHSQREPLVNMVTRAQLAILKLNEELILLERAQRSQMEAAKDA